MCLPGRFEPPLHQRPRRAGSRFGKYSLLSHNTVAPPVWKWANDSNNAMAQIEDRAGLGGKFRIARKCSAPMLPRENGIATQPTTEYRIVEKTGSFTITIPTRDGWWQALS